MTFLFFSSVSIVDLWILFKAVITRDMNLLCILIIKRNRITKNTFNFRRKWLERLTCCSKFL